MARKPSTRQCGRCGCHNETKLTSCRQCGTALIKRRFKMTPERIKLVKALATDKGLIIGSDDELYRLRLGAYGVGSCKEFKRQADFNRFIKDLKKLPGKRAA